MTDRVLGVSDQPGGTSRVNPAVLLPSFAPGTVTACHPVGSAVDGLFSALTDWNFVAVSGTGAGLVLPVAAVPWTVLDGELRARAAPTPAAAAASTATASRM